jgi:hypothetical protein
VVAAQANFKDGLATFDLCWWTVKGKYPEANSGGGFGKELADRL